MKILLVNPFASANYLSESLKKAKIESIALYTVDFNDIENYFCPSPLLFDKQIFLPNIDASQIINKLSLEQFNYVINGAENSVHLTDVLTTYFCPQYTNDPSTSHWRSNKIAMHERISELGIKSINQYEVNVNNYRSYSQNMQFPLFIKPLYGAGSHGAMKLNSADELDLYFLNSENMTLISTDVGEEKRHQFVLSECINGIEYLVDSFSKNGTHDISSILKYDKEVFNGGPIYNSLKLENNLLIRSKITRYVSNVLTALGVQNGFAHTEVFLSNNEVVLIEVNMRVSGAKGVPQRMINISGGKNQIDSFLLDICNIPLHNLSNNQVEVLFLYAMNDTTAPDLKAQLLNNKSIIHIEQLVEPSTVIEKKKNYSVLDIMAFVILVGDSTDELKRQCKYILEKDRLLGWASS